MAPMVHLVRLVRQVPEVGGQALAPFLHAGHGQGAPVFLPDAGPQIGAGLLVGVDQQNVMSGAPAHGSQVDGNRRFADSALLAANQNDHDVLGSAWVSPNIRVILGSYNETVKEKGVAVVLDRGLAGGSVSSVAGW